MKTTYIFGAIKTDRGPFPVTGIVSQFTGIRTISWMSKVRNKTQFLSDSVLVIAETICPFQKTLVTLRSPEEFSKYNIFSDGENNKDKLYYWANQADKP